MKKIIIVLVMACIFVSCKKKQEEVEVVPVEQPQKEEVYQPSHKKTVVNFGETIMYNYYKAPSASVASSVKVNFDANKPYTQPIEVVYSYPKGDTYTYVLENFGVWQNESGKYRIITDEKNTVWIQGQTKTGNFKEFVFFGDPKYNGSKIAPNSYRNLPKGEIRYR